MKFIIGQKDIKLLKNIRNAILSSAENPQIIECDNWDCTLFDLIEKEDTDYLILDINIMDSEWQDKVYELISKLEKTQIILTATKIDRRILASFYANGLIGYIPHYQIDDRLSQIITFILDFGCYVPKEVLERQPKKESETEKQTYRLPSGENLTTRQVEVLKLLKECLSNKQIAAILDITEPTVKLHIHGLFHKLGATNRTQIVLKAQKLGFI